MFVRNLANIMRLPMEKSLLHTKKASKYLQIKQDQALSLKISLIFVVAREVILKYGILSSKAAFLLLIFMNTEISKWWYQHRHWSKVAKFRSHSVQSSHPEHPEFYITPAPFPENSAFIPDLKFWKQISFPKPIYKPPLFVGVILLVLCKVWNF